MIRAHLNNKLNQQRGALLLEVMATLVIFALTVPMLLAIIHASIVEAEETITIRQSKILGSSKLEEYLTELEEEESGVFEDSSGNTIEGYTWTISRTPVDFWLDPTRIPVADYDGDRSTLSGTDKSQLFTMVRITLTVTSAEGNTDSEGNKGKSFTVSILREPTEDDVKDLDMLYR